MTVAAPLLADSTVVMASAMCPLPSGRESDPAVVKVVCDIHGFALYFSRSPLPFRRAPDAGYAPAPACRSIRVPTRLPGTIIQASPRPRWNRPNRSNNCASSNTAFASVWSKPTASPNPSIPPKTSNASERFMRAKDPLR